MNDEPAPEVRVRPTREFAAGRRKLTAPSIVRAAPDASDIARRRRMVRWSKRLMPVLAVLLLGSVALWPELGRFRRVSREAVREATAIRESNGIMLNARYRGIDTHGRPYTVTAKTARQTGPDRVDLVAPVADLIESSGRWLLVSADRGVYAPHERLLDMQGHVWLYRDDGTMMWAPATTLDVKGDINVSRPWVHIEGPFGVLDAQGDFLSGHDGVGQFVGPARLVLNQSSHAQPSATTTSAGATR